MLIQLAAKLWLGPQQIDPSLLCYKRRLIIVVYNYCKTKFVIKKLKISMKNSHQTLQYNVAFKKCKKNSHYLWWGVGANLSFSSPLGTVG